MISRQIRNLEERLDRTLAAWNLQLHTNKQHKKQLDRLRKDRGAQAAAIARARLTAP